MGLMEMTYCKRWILEIKDIAKGTFQNETGEKNTKGCVLIECSEKWLDFVCVWKEESIGRGREELIMTQSFCPE